MRRRIYNYAFLAVAALAVLSVGASISATNLDSANQDSETIFADQKLDLYGKEWKLIKIEGKATETDQAVIKFNKKSKTMGGNGSCNYISAKIARNADQLKFTDISTTVMACQKGLADESKFLENLKFVNKYKIDEGKLLLMVNDTVVLEFESR